MDFIFVLFTAAIAWLALIGAPVTTIVLAARNSQRSLNARLVILASTLVAIVTLAWATDIEFAWRPLNWIVPSAAYLAWALLVSIVFTLKPRFFGVILGLVASVSFIPGLYFGTIGGLALGFIAYDDVAWPISTTTVSPGLDCVVTGWGAAFSDEGHDVHLYRYLSWLPVLRHEVSRVVVNETEPQPGVPETTGCKEVVAGLVH